MKCLTCECEAKPGLSFCAKCLDDTANRLREKEGLTPMTIGAVFASRAEQRRSEMQRKPKKWMGSKPTTCDLCHKPLVDQFIDGRTAWGPWGIMCRSCHFAQGTGLGTGRGQLYDLKTLEKLDG
jgi:hypothetical protein